MYNYLLEKFPVLDDFLGYCSYYIVTTILVSILVGWAIAGYLYH